MYGFGECPPKGLYSFETGCFMKQSIFKGYFGTWVLGQSFAMLATILETVLSLYN